MSSEIETEVLLSGIPKEKERIIFNSIQSGIKGIGLDLCVCLQSSGSNRFHICRSTACGYLNRNNNHSSVSANISEWIHFFPRAWSPKASKRSPYTHWPYYIQIQFNLQLVHYLSRFDIVLLYNIMNSQNKWMMMSLRSNRIISTELWSVIYMGPLVNCVSP